MIDISGKSKGQNEIGRKTEEFRVNRFVNRIDLKDISNKKSDKRCGKKALQSEVGSRRRKTSKMRRKDRSQ